MVLVPEKRLRTGHLRAVVALLWLTTRKTSMGGERLWQFSLSAWTRKAPVVSLWHKSRS